MRRTVRATWALWAALTVAHVWFWSNEFELRCGLSVPVCLLLSTRWMPGEGSAWLAIAGALLCGILMPPFLAVVAVMAAITLALRAVRKPVTSGEEGADVRHDMESSPFDAVSFGLAPRPERMRLFVGSTSAIYLGPDAWVAGRRAARARLLARRDADFRCARTRLGLSGLSRARATCAELPSPRRARRYPFTATNSRSVGTRRSWPGFRVVGHRCVDELAVETGTFAERLEACRVARRTEPVAALKSHGGFRFVEPPVLNLVVGRPRAPAFGLGDKARLKHARASASSVVRFFFGSRAPLGPCLHARRLRLPDSRDPYEMRNVKHGPCFQWEE